MKPRTKREIEIVEMAAKLPPLTRQQMEWPKLHCFKNEGYHWKSGHVWCQCCGHEYDTDASMLAISLDVGGEFCPFCGNEIHLTPVPKKIMKYSNTGIMYSVVTTFKGFQVFRAFHIDRCNTRGEATRFDINEAFQIWLDESGKETIVTKHYSRGVYYLSWRYDSDFEIGRHNGHCGGYFVFDDLFDMTGFWFYPWMSVLSAFRRNGWHGFFANMRGVNPVELMKSLLRNSDIEMLAKTGQHEILRYWMLQGWNRNSDRKRDRFASIRIANRNGYIVKDASMWYDLLECMDGLGFDTHNALYVCPKDLKDAHDRFSQKMQRLQAKREKERKRKELMKYEETYLKQKGCYLGISFGNDDIVVKVLQTVRDFLDEGSAMHHCVYDNQYFLKPCLILSARRKDGKRLATIELSLSDYHVTQCRSACNGVPESRDEIISLVESHRRVFMQASMRKEIAV